MVSSNRDMHPGCKMQFARPHRFKPPATVIAIGIALLLVPLTVANAQETRIETIHQAQADRQKQLTPPRLNGVERVLDRLEDWGLITGAPRGCLSVVRLGLSGRRLRRRRRSPQAVWRRRRVQCVRRLFHLHVRSRRGRSGAADVREQPRADHAHRDATSTHRMCGISASATHRTRRTRPGSATRRRPEAPAWMSTSASISRSAAASTTTTSRHPTETPRPRSKRVLAGEHAGPRAREVQLHQQLGASDIRLAPAARLHGLRRTLSRAVRRLPRARQRPLLVPVARGGGAPAHSDPARELGDRAARPRHDHRHRRHEQRAVLPAAVARRRLHAARLSGLSLPGSQSAADERRAALDAGPVHGHGDLLRHGQGHGPPRGSRLRRSRRTRTASACA